MIFLSHNSADKEIVEVIARHLREAFGQESVFYDSWSIQPGDGIIDKMSAGLTDCKFFLFFVSHRSLKSNMVKLEWQNAMYKSTKTQVKIIPVRLDNCEMPQIMMQTLYIDLFNDGPEAALRKIFDVIEGKNTFPVGEKILSNLRSQIYVKEKKSRIRNKNGVLRGTFL